MFQPIGAIASDLAKQIGKAMQKDAEELAAKYDYDVDLLWYHYQRRSFGSLTTTNGGSEHERDRYFRAWKVAFERQAAAE